MFEFLLHLKKFSDHFKDLYKLELMTNFDDNLATSPGGAANTVAYVWPHLSLRMLTDRASRRLRMLWSTFNSFVLLEMQSDCHKNLTRIYEHL